MKNQTAATSFVPRLHCSSCQERNSKIDPAHILPIALAIGVLDACAHGVFHQGIRMPKTAYRPLIEPKLRTSVPRKAMREAVQRLVTLRKTNPTAYRALIEQHKGTVIRIVPG